MLVLLAPCSETLEEKTIVMKHSTCYVSTILICLLSKLNSYCGVDLSTPTELGDKTFL